MKQSYFFFLVLDGEEVRWGRKFRRGDAPKHQFVSYFISFVKQSGPVL